MSKSMRTVLLLALALAAVLVLGDFARKAAEAQAVPQPRQPALPETPETAEEGDWEAEDSDSDSSEDQEWSGEDDEGESAPRAAGAPAGDCRPIDPKADYTDDPDQLANRLRQDGAWPPCDRGGLDKSGGSTGLDQIQAAFDIFAWDTFVALNWPASSPGEPDPSRVIGDGKNGDNETVWESWKESFEIFLPNGAAPSAWGDPRVPPAVCPTTDGRTRRVLTQLGKAPLDFVHRGPDGNVLDEFSNPFKGGPIIDQMGRFARFEIAVNETMFDHIVTNVLYSRAGQRQYALEAAKPGSQLPKHRGKPAVQFPYGRIAKQDPDDPSAGVGSIMIKAGWMDLTGYDEEVVRTFHTKTGFVYTPAEKESGIEERCELKTMGLVGLHIAHKTCFAPQWVWATFEHVDNVPTLDDVMLDNLKDRYNFYKPHCTDCEPVNQPPADRPWNPNKGAKPSQIVRIDSIPKLDPNAERLNELYHQALARLSPDSVWRHYELISAQWPTRTNRDECTTLRSNPGGDPAPNFLANTTLETYIQGHTPRVSSNCTDCHGDATTTATGTKQNVLHADFTFLLERAN